MQTALPLKSPTGAFIAAQTRIFSIYIFTGEGRNGKRHMLLPLRFVAQRL